MTTVDKVLVIDDDKVVGDIVSAAANALGLQCVVTKDAATCLSLVPSASTLILLDLMMPEMDGIEVLRLLGEQQCKSRIVLMSGMDKRVIEIAEKLAQTLGLSVVGHLLKPFPLSTSKLSLKPMPRRKHRPHRPPAPRLPFPTSNCNALSSAANSSSTTSRRSALLQAK